MKHLHILLLFPLLFVVNDIQGQNTYGHADNIVMGKYSYVISVSSGMPVLLYKGSYDFFIHKSIVYSDKNGNLKLFNDKKLIRNGNYQVIDTLYLPSADNTCIPMPGQPDLMYIFTLRHYDNSPTNNAYDTLFYSLVDLNGNAGQGNIILSRQLFTSSKLDYNMAVTKHTNGRDYWLVVKKHLSCEFLSFHIKPGGIIDTIHSVAGLSPSLSGPQRKGLLFSPNGRWLADNIASPDTLQLLNFDATTGIVSDSNILYIPDAGYMLIPWRAAFSSDNSKLYVSHYDANMRLYQYDLNSGNQQAILNSKILIQNSQPKTPTDHGTMSLMSNGKIYSYIARNTYYHINANYFNAIEEPNQPGLSCNWNPKFWVLDSADLVYGRFPLFCSSWLQQPVDFSYTHTCAGENAQPTLFAFTDSVYQAEWHFGDSLAGGADTSSSLYPSYSYSQPGQYTVWVKALHYGMWDSIAKTIVIHQNPQIDIGIDTTLTGYDTLVLDPGGGYASYLWNTGDTTQTLTLYGSQMSGGSHNYWVEVTDTNGCSAKAYRTITYSGVGINEHKQQAWKVFPNPANEQLTIELPKALQEEAVLKLYNQSGAIVRRYEWPGQAQKLQVSLSGLCNGIYWLELVTEQRKYRQKVMKR